MSENILESAFRRKSVTLTGQRRWPSEAVALSLNLTRHRDYQRRKILFRLFPPLALSLCAIQNKSYAWLLRAHDISPARFSLARLRTFARILSRLSRERTVKELGRSITEKAKDRSKVVFAFFLRLKREKLIIIFHISLSDI